MTDPLSQLKRAHASKRRADERFRAAMLSASSDHAPAEIGRALKWSRQRVRKQLLRWKETNR